MNFFRNKTNFQYAVATCRCLGYLALNTGRSAENSTREESDTLVKIFLMHQRTWKPKPVRSMGIEKAKQTTCKFFFGHRDNGKVHLINHQKLYPHTKLNLGEYLRDQLI